MFKIAITDDTSVMRCRIIIRLIEMAGAVPVLVPRLLDLNNLMLRNEHLELVAEIVSDCNGIIIPGNKRDVHPHLYGQKFIHEETKKRLPQNPLNIRQSVELKMFEVAMSQKKPILGICGGMQLINCALGGSLVQHLPDDERTDNSLRENYHYDDRLKKLTMDQLEDFEEHFDEVIHGTKENLFKGTHPMRVLEGSTLAKIYEKCNPQANLRDVWELSIHHQGIFGENLAKDLKVVAMANDGLIEAVEHRNYENMFLLTQFHPECNASGIALGLIKEMIKS